MERDKPNRSWEDYIVSHPENCKAVATFIRVKAASLKGGDEKAQKQAAQLEEEAQEIERHLHREGKA